MATHTDQQIVALARDVVAHSPAAPTGFVGVSIWHDELTDGIDQAISDHQLDTDDCDLLTHCARLLADDATRYADDAVLIAAAQREITHASAHATDRAAVERATALGYAMDYRTVDDWDWFAPRWERLTEHDHTRQSDRITNARLRGLDDSPAVTTAWHIDEFGACRAAMAHLLCWLHEHHPEHPALADARA